MYQELALDKDFIITCPKIAALNNADNCPCGNSIYTLVAADSAEQELFLIDANTGVVSVSDGASLTAWYTYSLQITATSKRT